MKWSRLILGDDGGGDRLYLAGKPVRFGTALILRLRNEEVARVRIEGTAREPRAYLTLGGLWETYAKTPESERCPCVLSDGDHASVCPICGRVRHFEFCGPEVCFLLPAKADLAWPEGK